MANSKAQAARAASSERFRASGLSVNNAAPLLPCPIRPLPNRRRSNLGGKPAPASLIAPPFGLRQCRHLRSAGVGIAAAPKEMPRKYWRNMPETALVGAMVTAASAMGGNAQKAWEAIRAEAMHCTRCHLYQCATQTVFGEGPLDASILFVGEQPGDQEDLAGR